MARHDSAPHIVETTRAYERELAARMRVIVPDLRAKHDAMAADDFAFLRATFYHWAHLFPLACPELMDAPVVLAVGDLHLENYGTWRDPEARLVWGVNDFDEACPMPYTQDLARLATSARLAPGTDRLSGGEICAAILDGYRRNLECGGEPLVLEENNRRLRRAVFGREREPARFWEKLHALPDAPSTPSEARRLLLDALPAGADHIRFVRRRAGLGSLGRPRYTALASVGGSAVAREAKRLLPSAWALAHAPHDETLHYQPLRERAVRVKDPFLSVVGNHVLRRLSPHCSRITLEELDDSGHEARLLDAMGRDLANLHLGTPGAAAAIVRDLDARPERWLTASSKRLAQLTRRDRLAWAERRE